MTHFLLRRFGLQSHTPNFSSRETDAESYVTLEYHNGSRSLLYISGTATVPCTATVSTSEKMVIFDHPFFVPTGLSVSNKDLYFTGEHWADTTPVQGHDGLSYQANYVAQYVSEGRTDSPLHSHNDTIENIRVAEQICLQVGANPSGQ